MIGIPVPTTPEQSAEQPPPPKAIKSGVTRCKRKRRELVEQEWSVNVDYLRGKPFDIESDEDRVYVNSDNILTKRKSAQIASQAPEARLKAKTDRVKPILGAFAKRVNEALTQAKVGAALFECSKDMINAAGIGVVLCGYQARTETKQVPAVDPMTLSPDQQAGLQATKELPDDQAAELLQAYGIPTVDVPRVVSSRFYARRISPSDYLWPLDFERSDFDEAPWQGHSDRMFWSEAVVEFGLKDEDKQSILGNRSRNDTTLRDDSGSESTNTDDELVEYDEIFYWRAKYDPNEKHFDCIWRIVYIGDKVVVHEPWNGQKYLDGVGYVGATKMPLRVGTLDYVSDDAIPPSDSSIARPQVNEMIRSRTQMVQQRERSLPLRWHNVNLLDPLTNANLMRGVWQASIPVKGDGNRVLGEVARANYPAENFEFDRIIKSDLTESWGIDSNQLGQFARGRRTAAEAKVVESNFATQTGFQRARMAAFFCGIAEVIAGLVALYADDVPAPPAPPAVAEGQPQQPPIDTKQISQLFDYWVLPDSTVLLDANQQADKLMEVLDMVGKSGFVNPEPIIADILVLKGIDPAKVMIKPQPKPEEPPNISYRFSSEDLINPVVLGMLVEQGKAPSPQALQAAFAILRAAGVPHEVLPPATAENPQPPQGPLQGALPPGPGGPQRALPPADARPEWTAMPTISKRGDE